MIGIDGDRNVSGIAEGYAEKLQEEITEFISPLPSVYVQRELFDEKPVVGVAYGKDRGGD